MHPKNVGYSNAILRFKERCRSHRGAVEACHTTPQRNQAAVQSDRWYHPMGKALERQTCHPPAIKPPISPQMVRSNRPSHTAWL